MDAPRTTEAFRELLTPVKDPEQSFDINISELLQNYVRSFVEGSVPGNFNSAALMIQGSSSIYGKKVEYLHNLATKLYASLLKNKKEDGTKKDTKEREKHTKESKFSDPFCSTDIKLGKNLSCLRKKFAAKNAANKKASKKSDKKFTFVPVDLLPIDDKVKGLPFFDTQGLQVGLKGDFTLNNCNVTSSGWLLLPTVSSDMITSHSLPDYTLEDDHSDDSMCHDVDSDMPESTPVDEGYPPSSGYSETPPTCVPSSQGTDDGLGSLFCTPQETESQPQVESNDNTPTLNASPVETPMEGLESGSGDVSPGVEGIENIPLEDADVGTRPQRQSMRQALKMCQIPEDGASTQAEENAAAVKKAIQKKNTCNLPSRLKSKKDTKLKPTSEFCARTFFSMDRKFSKANCLSLEMVAFSKNPALIKRFQHIQSTLLAHNKVKRKKEKETAVNAESDDDEEIDPLSVDAEDIETEITGDNAVLTPLEAADIVIENSQMLPALHSNEDPLAEDEPMSVDDLDDSLTAYDSDDADNSFKEAAKLQCALFKEDLQQYVQTSDISQKVHEWEVTMRPFLQKVNAREEFDINNYGSDILCAFKENNRKQSLGFRDFCKGKEKYQIHRYFMALLPLVNIRNVDIEPEMREDGTQDISMHLLSRKMHHKELEQFGHTEGEHS